MNFNDILWYMKIALEEAEKAAKEGEVPVGSLIWSPDKGELIRTHNSKEKKSDPTAHAEIIAIQQASCKIKNWRLQESILFTTLEPCPMCLGAIVHARLRGVIFGSYDLKGGALSLGYNLNKDTRLNHQFFVMGGVLHFESSRLLSTFFKEMRKTYK